MLRLRKATFITLILSIFIMSGCGYSAPNLVEEEADSDLIVVGFSQLGAESNWRSANTLSMQETFTKENGYELIFEDGQQKQSNQFTAIRKFIQQDVDYIVLAPVTEEGWDTVLEEARIANIPVIIVDRMVDVSDEKLFTCWVGSNFKLEGLKVTEWLNSYLKENGIESEKVNIVSIKGTVGASSQIGRSAGLYSAVGKYGWNLLAEEEGEYTQARAREVMTSMLKKYDDINVVYCENDNEAFGAIEAIEAAGREVGPDIMNGQIMILSFDGVSEQAIEYAKEGKISCIGECNPLHGPRVQKIIESLENGEHPQKFEYVDENILSSIESIKNVSISDKSFPVTLLSEE